MPVSNQNMGYDPREMLATFYQQQNEAMGNYQNPSYAMQRGGPMGFDIMPPQPGQQRPPMPMPQPQPMPSPGVSPLPPPAVGGRPMMPPPMAGMQMLPFGGYRANGGPVQPGRAYVVGERGPELMVPQVPGTIVPNTGAAASPMNRPYAELAGSTTGSLANRGTRPVGRSANDPQRMNEMAMRRLRSQGDIVGAARLANSNAWLEARVGGPAMRAPMMPMMMPPQPSANRAPMPMPGTPGQSLPAPEMTMPDAGAPADAAAPAAPPPMDAPPPSFEQAFNQSPLAGAGPAPLGQPLPPMQVPAGTMARMPGLEQGAFKGAYQEAPPLMSSVPIPGTDQMQPMVMGQPKGAPVSRAQPPKPAEAPKVPDGIQYEKDALGNITGGKYPAWDEARQTWVIRSMDLDGNGVVSPQERAAANAGAGAGAPAAGASRAPSSFLNALKF